MSCQECNRRELAYERAQSDLIAVAKRVARTTDPSPRQLALIEKARVDRDIVRVVRDQHAAECEATS